MSYADATYSQAAPITSAADRVIPHNDEAERSVLAAIMLDEDVAIEAFGIVKAEDFYRRSHRIMFEGMANLANRGIPIDQLSLADHLTSTKEIELIGGRQYILEVASNAAALANWEYHASIVARLALLRKLIKAADQLLALGFDAPDNITEVVAEAEKLVLDATEQHVPDNFRDLNSLLTESFNMLDRLSRENRALRGIPTGFPDIDNVLSGMRAGDLIILAARPGLGKTSMALNMAVNAAKTGTTVAFFSLEMPAAQIVQRILCSEARVDMQRINTGKLKNEDWSNIAQACSRLGNLNFFIDDTPALSMPELRARARRVMRGAENGLIVLDYLQLMSTPGAGFKDRYLEVAAFSRGLKILAKELGVPVIALSQLNRSPEQRKDKRPQLSDLRESGSIEQDADVVMFLDRSMSRAEAEDEGRPDDGEATLIIAKHRNGPTADIPLIWLGQYTKYISRYSGPEEAASDYEEPRSESFM